MLAGADAFASREQDTLGEVAGAKAVDAVEHVRWSLVCSIRTGVVISNARTGLSRCKLCRTVALGW